MFPHSAVFQHRHGTVLGPLPPALGKPTWLRTSDTPANARPHLRETFYPGDSLGLLPGELLSGSHRGDQWNSSARCGSPTRSRSGRRSLRRALGGPRAGRGRGGRACPGRAARAAPRTTHRPASRPPAPSRGRARADAGGAHRRRGARALRPPPPAAPAPPLPRRELGPQPVTPRRPRAASASPPAPTGSARAPGTDRERGNRRGSAPGRGGDGERPPPRASPAPPAHSPPAGTVSAAFPLAPRARAPLPRRPGRMSGMSGSA